MARLMDMAVERLKNLVLDMARLSENAVSTAIEAYGEGRKVSEQIFAWSEQLRILQDEVSELCVELIARYQPVASDLRYVKSCLEISYGYSRFGRYAYDIAQILDTFGDLSRCDMTRVHKAGAYVKEMMNSSIQAFNSRDVALAKKVAEMDSAVDRTYLEHIGSLLESPQADLKCSVSATLMLRYLERIADHAQYIGESVLYIVTGERAHRR